MFAIKEVTRIEMAFPTRVDDMMPKWEDIPKDYKDGRTKWNKLFSDWFYCGLSTLDLTPKEGVDKQKALAHIKTVMGSFDPKHEHKEAGVAFLFNEWFEDVKWERKEPAKL